MGKLIKKKQPTLNLSKTELYTYTGDRLNVCGSIDVKANYISYHLWEAGEGPSLLGRNWLSEVRFDWNEIFQICQDQLPVCHVLEKCSDIFRDKLSTVVGMKTHINVPENSVPKFYMPRPLAYAL